MCKQKNETQNKGAKRQASMKTNLARKRSEGFAPSPLQKSTTKQIKNILQGHVTSLTLNVWSVHQAPEQGWIRFIYGKTNKT